MQNGGRIAVDRADPSALESGNPFQVCFTRVWNVLPYDASITGTAERFSQTAGLALMPVLGLKMGGESRVPSLAAPAKTTRLALPMTRLHREHFYAVG